MKKLEQRAVICLLLGAFLIIGMALYFFRFISDGSSWATYWYNQHIFHKGELISGNIYDVNGARLLGNVNGKAKWIDSAEERKAIAHAIGDSNGDVATGGLSAFRDRLLGYNVVTGVYNPSGKGNDIYLSINKDICRTAYESMSGRNGCVGVYNYHTGEVICMVSTPTFDPKNPPKSTKAKPGTFVNKFLRGTITPGSIFKLVTAAAAIENYKDIESWKYNCKGSSLVAGRKINCTRYHGTENFEQALANSCNGGFAELTRKVGPSLMNEYVDKLGLTKSYDIDGVHIAKGSFKFPKNDELSLSWAGIGQWKDLINPCSMLIYMSAIAKGDGKGTEPKLLHSRLGEISETKEMIKPATAKKLRKMMKNNVESEYGKYNFPGLDIYAKSGTAEIGTGNPNAWFCGFIKNERYPYAFIVCVENGGYGSQIAGPVANTVLQKVVDTDSAATP